MKGKDKHEILLIFRPGDRFPPFVAALCKACIPRYIDAGYDLKAMKAAKNSMNDPKWCWCCKKDVEDRL